MTRLLDARTSQNASYGNTISIPLPANTAGAIAELGLDVTECPLLCECLRNKPKRCTSRHHQCF
ncbi:MULTISPECIES: hypothetical protein [Paenibacillus]|uniref:hypothetical protein n=1 Tax=Paenibacillus TaxID=44249 RepID=UPI000F99858B|nr:MULTISPECIES: hypothetical protein [Paenibacillus]MCV9947765.1 hypothetical protein [Paenibacillus sp. BT-177]MEE4566786.1 hypothetical protein [Paenibacillus polymyxa]WPQ54746.1 hypothetical protein SKN87_14200 [Paenibacillus polymyxa]